MEIDQFLFKKVYNFCEELFKSRVSSDKIAVTATLKDLNERLSILACLLTGEQIQIQAAESVGGFSSNIFFLPQEYSYAPTLEANQNFYLFRVIYLSVQKSLSFNWYENKNYTLEESQKKARETFPLVIQKMQEIYPNAKEFIPECTNPSYLFGIWMQPLPKYEPKTLEDSNLLKNSKYKQANKTEKEAPPKEKINSLQIDKKAQGDYTLNHNFEKIDTLEEFKGNWRDFDGSDEMDVHQDALKELDLRDTIRVDTPTHSVYKTDFLFLNFTPESKESDSKDYFVSYDEWDIKKKTYKKDFCKVFPQNYILLENDYYTNTISQYGSTLNKLRQRFSRIMNEMETVKKRNYGDDIDFDAIVDFYTDIFIEHTPSENLYLSKRNKRRELSILVLLDLSLSTDSYVAGSRILDVEKESLILFGELCNEYGDRFAINGFSSRTRNHCNYYLVKRFEDNWNIVKHKIGSLQPEGYTRIGPAIRHATSLLESETSKDKWILLLSDGKPNDYDKYEGHYGIEDIKKAVGECNQKKINLYALAVDKQAKHYFPHIFGRNYFQILPNPLQLPEAITNFYTNMKSK